MMSRERSIFLVAGIAVAAMVAVLVVRDGRSTGDGSNARQEVQLLADATARNQPTRGSRSASAALSPQNTHVELRRRASEIVESGEPLARCKELCASRDSIASILLPFVFEEWVTKDAADACSAMEQLAEAMFHAGLHRIVLDIPDLTSARASEYWELDTNPEMDSRWKKVLLHSFARSDPLAAIQFIKERNIEKIAPDTARELARSMQAEGVDPAAYTWPKSSEFWEGTGLGLQIMFSRLGSSDQVLAAFERVPAELRAHVAGTVFSSAVARSVPADEYFSCATKVLDLAYEGQNERVQQEVIEAAVNSYLWAGGNLEEALKYADHNRQWMGAIAAGYGSTKPEEGGKWVLGMESGPGKDEAMRHLVSSWLIKDSYAAGEWVGSLGPGPARDSAIHAMVGFLVEKESVPEAIEWLERISDERLKAETREFIRAER